LEPPYTSKPARTAQQQQQGQEAQDDVGQDSQDDDTIDADYEVKK
jgi:hypothetical protein